jgi:hypothetical protein
MRLLQLHEYLALLDGGANTQPAADALSKACLQQAQSIWPRLRISPWMDWDRRIECVAECHPTGKLLVHVSTDWKNCFLILVVPPSQLQAEAYLLFDIGAEYRQPRFICPAFDLDQVADEETIRRHVPQLQGKRNPSAVLGIGDGTYIQAYAEHGMFDVEHQLVSLSSHYCLEKRVNAETVVNMFLSYAFGKKESAREFTWKKMEL